MKVLQIGKFYPVRGGVEKVMVDLTTGLSLRGIDCDMLCAAVDRPQTIRLNEHGRVLAVRSLGKVKATMMSPAMIVRMRKICQSYDIVHIHYPDPMAALALRLSGYRGKVILHWHSDILKQRQLLKIIKPLQSWLIRRADVIVGTSPVYIAQSPWLTQVQDKCMCIPIGIDPLKWPEPERVERLRARYGNRKIIFSMGRLVEYKGFEYLIDAARLLSDDYVVLIGGVGHLHDSLQKRIDDAGLSKKVYLLGFVDYDDLPTYHRASTLFCLSSIMRTEAFGVVQIEAMSAGRPLVATNIAGSGVPWVNAHGVSGLNVETRSPEALAEAITAITKNDDQYNKYCQRSVARYKELFTKPMMIDNVQSLYQSLLSKHTVHD